MTLKTRLGAAGLTAMLAALSPAGAWASSHREAPLISEDPSADNTDLYVFTSPDDPTKVTILAMYIGLEEPGGGPNWLRFSDDVLYEIKIDNNGDGRANDIVYQFSFTTHYNRGGAMGVGGAVGPAGTFFYNVGHITGLPTPSNFNGALVAQTMNVRKIVGGRAGTDVGVNIPVAPTYVGRFAYGAGGRPATDDARYTSIWQSAVTNLTGGGRVFAGPTDDPFFVDLGAVFDDVTFRDSVMGFGSRGGGYDYVAGYNVHTIAIEIPAADLVAAGTPTDPTNRGNVIGVYATASRPRLTLRRNCVTDARVAGRPVPASNCAQGYGQYVQVSRLGIPLVNEVLIPLGLKDAWNAGAPTDDAAIFGQYILSPSLPTYAEVLYGPMGARAAAGYRAPTRPVGTATIMNNDMLALVVGAPGLIPGTPAGGFTPADLLRFNVRTPPSALPTNAGNPTLATGRSRLGAAGGDLGGFPNGRRLFDDVVDIEERYVLNTLGNINAIPFGDGVDGNDNGNAGPNGRTDAAPYRTTFPFVQIPLRGDAQLVHRQEPARPM
ncbi:MAG: DUF4331 domain-containing protein [Polyangiales bacterium]